MKSVFSGVMLATLLGFTASMLNEASAAVGDRLSISRTEVNVRSGPSLQDSIVMSINPGEVIVEIDRSGDWYLVEFPNHNRRGWIYGPLLDKPSTPKVEPESSASAPLAVKTTEPEPTIPKRITPSTSQTPLQRATDGRETTFARSERSWFDGDPVNGEKVFYKCGACHATARGVNTIGPSLWGVVGSRPAQTPGFGYSSGMRRFAANGAVWDEKTLDEFIRRPPRLVRGTSMPFSGIRDPKDRRDLIAYLRKLGV